MDDKTIMQEAAEVVIERGKVYGSPMKNMTRIAGLWSHYLGVTIEPHQAAMCLNLLKISRLAETPAHRDSIVDGHGYFHVYAECLK